MQIEISYNGCFPNLCRGELIVTIDGVIYEFPPFCMVSGGHIYMDDDGDYNRELGEWDISEWPEGFPEEYKQPVLDKINEEIPWGCCGGCI